MDRGSSSRRYREMGDGRKVKNTDAKALACECGWRIGTGQDEDGGKNDSVLASVFVVGMLILDW